MTSANTHAQEQTDQHCEETITEQVSPNPIKAYSLPSKLDNLCIEESTASFNCFTAAQEKKKKKQTAEFTTTFQLI